MTCTGAVLISVSVLGAQARRRLHGPAWLSPEGEQPPLPADLKDSCAGEDLNLHGVLTPQGPQPCASTNSATSARRRSVATASRSSIRRRSCAATSAATTTAARLVFARCGSSATRRYPRRSPQARPMPTRGSSSGAASTVATRNRRVDRLDDVESEGIGVRVLVGGAWGFACDDRLSAESARDDGPAGRGLRASRAGRARPGARARGAGRGLVPHAGREATRSRSRSPTRSSSACGPRRACSTTASR